MSDIEVSFETVLEAFNFYGRDVLLEKEWYEFLLSRGVPEGRLFDLTLEFDKRKYLIYIIYPSVFLEDFERRAKKFGLTISKGCELVYICKIGCPRFDKELRLETVVAYFRDGKFITYGEFRDIVYKFLQFIGRREFAEVEFMGFLMRFYGLNLERAAVLHATPIILPEIEGTWIELSEIEDSLKSLGVLNLARKLLVCLGHEMLPGFIKIEPEDVDEEV